MIGLSELIAQIFSFLKREFIVNKVKTTINALLRKRNMLLKHEHKRWSVVKDFKRMYETPLPSDNSWLWDELFQFVSEGGNVEIYFKRLHDMLFTMQHAKEVKYALLTVPNPFKHMDVKQALIELELADES